jgi:hypothetical protein
LVLLFKALKRRVGVDVAEYFFDQYRNELINSKDPLIVESLRESRYPH